MIYFIEAVGYDMVKIGRTSAATADARLHDLSTASFAELRVMRTIDGDVERELALHERFAAHRVRGEWFALVPIREHIAQLDAFDATVPKPDIEWVEHACIDCGVVRCLRVNRAKGVRAETIMAAYPRCKSCSMRKVWRESTALRVARAARRKPCATCGKTEPKLSEGAQHHAACWAARGSLRKRERDPVGGSGAEPGEGHQGHRGGA